MPTWNNDIADIVQNNCVVCHSSGGVGPFDLTKFKNVKNRAKTIVDVTKHKYMPPWPADKNYSHFIGEKGLSDEEIATIENWVLNGCPVGSGPARVLSVPEYQKNPKPDMILKIPSVTLASDYKDRFYLVTIPGELPENTYLQSVYLKPGLPAYVHHFNGHLLLYDKDKKAKLTAAELQDISYGTGNNITIMDKLKQDDGSLPLRIHSAVNYLPGVFYTPLPNGIGTIPLTQKFCFVGNDMHYGPSEKVLTDSSELHLYFTKTPPSRQLEELMLGTNGAAPTVPPLQIKPNTVSAHYSKFVVNKDISIITVNPHMHMLGKSFKAYAIKPNGDTIALIHIPRWDFRWQYFYTFTHMIKIPKGSTIIAEGVYDNTENNPNNPNSPPKLVGERLEYGGSSMRASDEMFQFIITYTDYKPGDEFVKLDGSN